MAPWKFLSPGKFNYLQADSFLQDRQVCSHLSYTRLCAERLTQALCSSSLHGHTNARGKQKCWMTLDLGLQAVMNHSVWVRGTECVLLALSHLLSGPSDALSKGRTIHILLFSCPKCAPPPLLSPESHIQTSQPEVCLPPPGCCDSRPVPLHLAQCMFLDPSLSASKSILIPFGVSL